MLFCLKKKTTRKTASRYEMVKFYGASIFTRFLIGSCIDISNLNITVRFQCIKFNKIATKISNIKYKQQSVFFVTNLKADIHFGVLLANFIAQNIELVFWRDKNWIQYRTKSLFKLINEQKTPIYTNGKKKRRKKTFKTLLSESSQYVFFHIELFIGFRMCLHACES